MVFLPPSSELRSMSAIIRYPLERVVEDSLPLTCTVEWHWHALTNTHRRYGFSHYHLLAPQLPAYCLSVPFIHHMNTHPTSMNSNSMTRHHHSSKVAYCLPLQQIVDNLLSNDTRFLQERKFAMWVHLILNSYSTEYNLKLVSLKTGTNSSYYYHRLIQQEISHSMKKVLLFTAVDVNFKMQLFSLQLLHVVKLL